MASASVTILSNDVAAIGHATVTIETTTIGGASVTILPYIPPVPYEACGRNIGMGAVAFQWKCNEDPLHFEFALAKVNGLSIGNKEMIEGSRQIGSERSQIVYGLSPGTFRFFIRSITISDSVSEWIPICLVITTIPKAGQFSITGILGSTIHGGAQFFASHKPTSRLIGVEFREDITLGS